MMSDDVVRHIGELIDSLGVETELDNDDLVAAAVVLLKVIEPDGQVRLSIAWSEGMSWLERVGMVAVAYHEEATPTPAGDP
ncbi:MAG: hypothetical protein KY469_10705 [Actinobacteria bacterium]|nr:hypothetical protein [Actinomycetota bacterium]